MRKVLIAGGSGNVGSQLIKYYNLKYPHYHVVNYDKVPGTDRGFPVSRADSLYYWQQGDPLDRGQTWNNTIGINLLVNCVWSDEGADSLSSPQYVNVTMGATNTFMHCASIRGVSRYIQVSTADVYGSRVRGASAESDALAPDTTAAGIRGAADVLVKSIFKQADLGALIVRPTNLYGPGFDQDTLLNRLIHNIAAGRTPPKDFSEETGRDWLHIDDFCQAVDFIVRNGDVGEIYNIAAGEIISDAKLVKMVAKACGKRSPVKWPEPDKTTGVKVSTAKLQRLGWEPSRNIADSLPELVEAFSAQESAADK